MTTLTAEDIVGFAARQGFKLGRMGCANSSDPRDYCACPRRTLANEVTEDKSMYKKEIIEAVQAKFNLTPFDQECLEIGFEGWDVPKEYKANQYYKLGKQLYRQSR